MRLALAVLVVALALTPGAASARTVTFGSTLNKAPTDFDPPATCDSTGANMDIGPCTRVSLGFAATGAVRGAIRAPVSGTITRMRLRAGTPGAVRVTLARLQNLDRDGGLGEARVVSRGTLLRAQGPEARKPIESFRTRLKVTRGDYLAVEGSSTSMLRCEGGDSEQLIFQPPLAPFGDWQRSEGFDDCTMLLQATITTPTRARKRRS